MFKHKIELLEVYNYKSYSKILDTTIFLPFMPTPPWGFLLISNSYYFLYSYDDGDEPHFKLK